ncbi:hypothetical protein FEE95_12470 [Maribacter algarum]|uniref:TraB/GumN family protein n=1 Tax=Maribacter algarum (ex Zhang et al. 2020) TaxID=2578118 RepID=A0A5S3PRI1_9FLAO|nr:hypothetical protein [Maribacter algarum]TMM57294.1 hypothetical protein FEE95_12470 [Maribacter algarum]
MKNLIFIVFLFILSCSIKTKKPSEVTVIGTVHFPTEYVNADSIYKALQRVKPDIIAMEADSSVFNTDFSFKKTYDENEYNAVLKYLESNPETMIRPIGFEGRNDYRKKIGIYSEAGFVYEAMYDLLDDEKLSNPHSDMLLHYENLWAVTEVFKKETLTNINHSFVDRLIDSVNAYQYVKTRDIVKTRPEFEIKIMGADGDSVSLKSYFEKWIRFEGTQRNEALANNLIHLVELYPQKRIVALTGFKHRSYIINSLKRVQKELGFNYQEFYEFEQ